MAAAAEAIARQLVPRCGGESRSHLASVFHELDGALRRFLLRRVRCPHDADDLAQEVYLRMARHADLAGVECLKAFAYQIALNLVRDRSRRSHTRATRKSVPIESLDLPGGDDPLDHALHDERLEEIEAALARMSPACRKALLMHRFDGLTYGAIAECLGVSVSMVEKYISAALLELRMSESRLALAARARS